MLRIVESVYLETPKRPTGDHIMPPGKYGETYFIRQTDLWNRGCKWLAMTNRGLTEIFSEYKNAYQPMSRTQKNIFTKICSDIEALVSFEYLKNEDL